MPDPDYFGPDSLEIVAHDGTLQSAPAVVRIDVVPVADPPDLGDDAANGNEDTALDIDVFANDTDADGDQLTITSASQPSNGAVACSPSACRYTPAADFHGQDGFSYTATDGMASRTAQVVVTVASINDAPRAVADATSTAAGSAVTIDVLANDRDVDGDQLTISSWTQPSGGAVTCATTCSYQPSPGFAGPDGFSYVIEDGHGATATATVSITVNGPTRQAQIQQPIDADGSSVFSKKRSVVPVKFTLFENGPVTCALPAAQIAVRRINEAGGAVVDAAIYTSPSDAGSYFRREDCTYGYNIAASSLGVGTYEVSILIDGVVVGRAAFTLAR